MAEKLNRHLSFPFRIGPNGRIAQVTSIEKHVKEELMQLILTNEGERIFLPNFGGNTRQLIFSNVDDSFMLLTRVRLIQTINKWLGHRLTIEDLTFQVVNDNVELFIKYRVSGSIKSNIIKFQRTEGV
jgi:phage baseplate assembly protein W